MPWGRTRWDALKGHSVNQSTCQVLRLHQQRLVGVACRARGRLFQKYNALLHHQLVDNLTSDSNYRCYGWLIYSLRFLNLFFIEGQLLYRILLFSVKSKHESAINLLLV